MASTISKECFGSGSEITVWPRIQFQKVKKAGINKSVRNNLKTTIPALGLCSADHRPVHVTLLSLHCLLLCKGLNSDLTHQLDPFS